MLEENKIIEPANNNHSENKSGRFQLTKRCLEFTKGSANMIALLFALLFRLKPGRELKIDFLEGFQICLTNSNTDPLQSEDKSQIAILFIPFHFKSKIVAGLMVFIRYALSIILGLIGTFVAGVVEGAVMGIRAVWATGSKGLSSAMEWMGRKNDFEQKPADLKNNIQHPTKNENENAKDSSANKLNSWERKKKELSELRSKALDEYKEYLNKHKSTNLDNMSLHSYIERIFKAIDEDGFLAHLALTEKNRLLDAASEQEPTITKKLGLSSQIYSEGVFPIKPQDILNKDLFETFNYALERHIWLDQEQAFRRYWQGKPKLKNIVNQIFISRNRNDQNQPCSVVSDIIEGMYINEFYKESNAEKYSEEQLQKLLNIMISCIKNDCEVKEHDIIRMQAVRDGYSNRQDENALSLLKNEIMSHLLEACKKTKGIVLQDLDDKYKIEKQNNKHFKFSTKLWEHVKIEQKKKK